MGIVDQVDDRTFKVEFSTEGVAKLRDEVKDKLKDFMGDYTDDTLVEYVIVLLRNGRRKEEAKNELNVFLGDESDSFVAWLWDHLSANLDKYTRLEDTHVEEAIHIKSSVNSLVENKVLNQIDAESRRDRRLRKFARNAVEPPLISSEVHKTHYEEKNDREATHERSSSPQRFRRKRSQADDQQYEQVEVDAPRRLLQSGLRNALAISNPSNSVKEPSLKRLRSVVSASTQDLSSTEPPRRLRSVARVLNPMATVMKAAAEAAEDVRKTKPGKSVFDRISLPTDIPMIPDQHAEFKGAASEPYEYFNEHGVQMQSQYPHGLGFGDGDEGTKTMYETYSDRDVMSDDDGLDDPVIIGHSGFGVHHGGNFVANDDDYSVRVQSSVGLQPDNSQRLARVESHNHAMAAATRLKMANLSNLYPAPEYQENRDVGYVESQKPFHERKIGINEAIMKPKVTNNTVSIGNRNGNFASDIQKQPSNTQISSAGTISAVRPLEDTDSRTVFVSNVHFGATKDSVSRHFNKFGDILKVIIVTDPTSGQPVGSAFVEFMRKEAADDALSLDGTSFMSRIVKIVKKSSAQQDTAPTTTPSRASRGSPYTAGRYSRASFPRGGGVMGGFRGRTPFRGGARSLQWKRDAAPNPADAAASSAPGNTGSAPLARSLTYVRTGSK